MSSLILSSCSSSLSVEQIAPMDQKSIINYIEIVPSEAGFYYVDDALELRFYDLKKAKDIVLGPLDEKTSTYTYSYMGSTIYKYGEHLCYLTNYTNAEGVSYSSFTMQTLDGKDIASTFDLPYIATQFLIHNGYVVCTEMLSDGQCLIHIHDLNGKELSAIKEESYVDNFLADGNRIYYVTRSAESSVLKYMDCENLTSHLVDVDFQTFVFENLDKMSVYSCESTEDPVIHSSIIDLQNKEVVFRVDDRVINYFDEKYIYTSSTKDSSIKYSIYDWNGELVKEIIPSVDLLGDENQTNNLFWKTNGSEIIRVVDNYIVASSVKDNRERVYICDIESGSCRFISE